MTHEKRDFNAEAANWDAVPARVKAAEDVANAIIEDIPLSPKMGVLDFGCGTGLLSLRLQPLVRTLTCLDSSQGMLNVLSGKVHDRALTNVKVQHVDIEAGDPLPGRYDLIVTSMTMHHVENVERMLRLFADATSPGGALCIADLDLEGGRFHADNTGVFHQGFDRNVLKQHMLACGYEDLRDRTATVIEKPGANGEVGSFSIFLISGRHP